MLLFCGSYCGPYNGIQQSICGAQSTSRVTQVLQVSNLHALKELIVLMKTAFNIQRSRRQWDNGVGHIAGKEVYNVQTIFPSILTALHLLCVHLHSVGHFCLVSLQAHCDSRQHMFQFAVRFYAFWLCVLQL